MIHTFFNPQDMPGCKRKMVSVIVGLVASIAMLGLWPRVLCGEPTLAPEVITSATPPAAAVEAFMNEATQLLQSDKAPDQEVGRNAIIKYVNPATNQPQPTAGFLLAYSKSLNSKLVPLAKHANWRVRLNGVLAAERVASKAGNAAEELAPSIKAFLADSNEGVVLWAVKASKYVAAKRADEIIPALIDAAKRFPSTVAVVYQALGSIKPPTSQLINVVQDVMEARIALYRDGIPPDPLAERGAINALVDTQWWKLQNAQQQTRTAQLFVNLASVVGQRVNSQMTNEQRSEMADVIRSVGGGMAAAGIFSNNPALTSEGQKIQKLPTAVDAKAISDAAVRVGGEVKKAFPAITQPPTIAASNPTTQSDKLNGTR